jgi:hypothetical protein
MDPHPTTPTKLALLLAEMERLLRAMQQHHATSVRCAPIYTRRPRQAAPLSPACHTLLMNRAVTEQAQYPRYAPTATFRQASRRPKGVDPQQAGL